MEIEDANELIYFTYFMLDWTKVKQSPSSMECVTCGRKMNVVEEVKDKKGLRYEGRVCHNCKTVLWVKKD